MKTVVLRVAHIQCNQYPGPRISLTTFISGKKIRSIRIPGSICEVDDITVGTTADDPLMGLHTISLWRCCVLRDEYESVYRWQTTLPSAIVITYRGTSHFLFIKKSMSG